MSQQIKKLENALMKMQEQLALAQEMLRQIIIERQPNDINIATSTPSGKEDIFGNRSNI